jgi:hypothetical protein
VKKISTVKPVFDDHRKELEVFCRDILGPTLLSNINQVLGLKKPAKVKKVILEQTLKNYDS